MTDLPNCYRCGEPPCRCKDGITLYHGDCREILPFLEGGSVSLIYTDPPYGLEFMGKEWDKPHKARIRERIDGRTNPRIGKSLTRTPESYTAGLSMQSWFTEVFTAILPVCKPGAMLGAFGGTRTHHRLTCGIEDAGWEVRDCLMWLYGSGFPKSLDISKAIDKAAGAEREAVGNWKGGGYAGGKFANSQREGNATQDGDTGLGVRTAPATDAAKEWEGYGTSLKPAWEPIVLAMKPLDGTFAANALKHGVAGINVDGGRIGTTQGDYDHPGNTGIEDRRNVYGDYAHGNQMPPHPSGRWPANLILSHHESCRQVGVKKVKGSAVASGPTLTGESSSVARGKFAGVESTPNYADADGLEEVADWECAEECPVRMLDEQSGESTSSGPATPQGANYKNAVYGVGMGGCESGANRRADTGIASRFFKTFAPCRFAYIPKASGRDRGNLPAEDAGPLFPDESIPAFKNTHPTCKPTELMRYLLRLLYPPSLDAVCLDPFAGSGTTGVAAKQMGRKCILIEVEEEYVKIAARRLEQGVLLR